METAFNFVPQQVRLSLFFGILNSKVRIEIKKYVAQN
jgi:hypothetical protein